MAASDTPAAPNSSGLPETLHKRTADDAESKKANVSDKLIGALTPHQRKVFEGVTSAIEDHLQSVLRSPALQNHMLSLTGPAGTGKTFLIARIAAWLASCRNDKGSDYDFIVTAPTHKAVSVLAEHLGSSGVDAVCKTIHSFLGIKPIIDYKTGEERYEVDKTVKFKGSTSVLIVDESSMVGAGLFDYIAEAVEGGRVSMVLFIGDPYQLLPVNDDISPVFSLENQFALEEVVRQARENPIIAMATEIRRRIAAGDFIDLQTLLQPWMVSDGESIRFFHNRAAFVEDFRSHETWFEDDRIITAHTNRNVDAFNRELRRDYWRSKGVANPPTLLPGDRVRFKEAYTVRDTPIFHNNEVVTLRSAKRMYDEKLDIEIWECEAQSAMSQKFYVVDPGSLKPFNQKLQQIAAMAKKEKYPKNRELWKTFYGLKNLYADVQYTFASTIHKLQGSTYERVYVDLFTLEHVSALTQESVYRLVYVAITRASLQVTIFLARSERNATPPAAVDVEWSRRELDRLLSDIDF